MSTLDAGFYFVEHQNVPMHIGSLAVFEGPAPAYAELLALYEAKLPLVRRYRQIVRTLPVPDFRPYWSDDQAFDLGYHLRHAAVPPPGGPEQLREMSARIFAQRLDRSRPLWEAWFLEGIKGGRWAILSKVHHAMVDGIGGADLMEALFEAGPDPAPPDPAPPWAPRPGPSAAEMIAGGVVDTVTWPLQQLAGLPGFLLKRLPRPGEGRQFGTGLPGRARRLTVPTS